MPPRHGGARHGGGRGGHGGARHGGGHHGGGHHGGHYRRPIVHNMPAMPVFVDYEIPADYVYTYVPEVCPDPRRVYELVFAARGRLIPEVVRQLCLMRYCQQRRMMSGTPVPNNICG